MKFTTFIPTHYNDGTDVKPATLNRIIDALWEPFRGMTDEGPVTGHWIDDDGTHYTDRCRKISIKCSRDEPNLAIRTGRRAGRRLRQRAMDFEVSGYDGVQFLRVQ